MAISANAALAKAKTVTRWAVGMCDEFVANMYGFSSSGYNTAVDNWKATPASLKHPGDMNAPAGALMFWGGGDGHVAISAGNGTIISTDINGAGTVGTAPATAISSRWGKPYLGWAYPFFQGKQATSSLGGWSGSTSVANATDTSDILGAVSPDAIASGFLSAFVKPFEGFLSLSLWGIESLMGLALIGVGVFLLMTRTKT